MNEYKNFVFAGTALPAFLLLKVFLKPGKTVANRENIEQASDRKYFSF
jgi:hypothetical protein